MVGTCFGMCHEHACITYNRTTQFSTNLQTHTHTHTPGGGAPVIAFSTGEYPGGDCKHHEHHKQADRERGTGSEPGGGSSKSLKRAMTVSSVDETHKEPETPFLDDAQPRSPSPFFTQPTVEYDKNGPVTKKPCLSKNDSGAPGTPSAAAAPPASAHAPSDDGPGPGEGDVPVSDSGKDALYWRLLN